MGVGKAVTERLIQVATSGLSNLFGVTGKNGLIHEESLDPALIIDDDGFYFIENVKQLYWKDLISLEECDDVLHIKFRGGLNVRIPLCFVSFNFSDELQEEYDYDDNEILASRPCCKNDRIIDFDCDYDVLSDRIKDTKFRKRLATSLGDVFWASNMGPDLISEKFSIGGEELISCCIHAAVIIFQISIISSDGARYKTFKDYIENLDSFFIATKKSLTYPYFYDEESFDGLVARTFALSFYVLLENVFKGKEIKIDYLSERYGDLRNAKAFGWDYGEDNRILSLLLARDYRELEDFEPFGSDAWAKQRKIIVCSDDKADIESLCTKRSIPNIMIMDAQDLIDYNDKAPEDLQLKFEVGHPRNGLSYIQHPMCQNVYIDMMTFHSSMLERKYNELIRLLEALGAKEITCRVEDDDKVEEKKRRRTSVNASVDKPLVGEVSGKCETARASSQLRKLYKKLEKKIVNRILPDEKPYIPENLQFYPFEEDWKNLARSVMNGKRVEEETTLTYSKDYAVTGKTLLNLEAKIKSLIPGYEFGAGAGFSQEVESELKQLKSTVWHYHVRFNEPDIADVSEREPRAKRKSSPKRKQRTSEIEDDAAELLFIKRAKRYIAQYGDIKDAQYASLETFAKKYKISDMRMEELIEEAFE